MHLVRSGGRLSPPVSQGEWDDVSAEYVQDARLSPHARSDGVELEANRRDRDCPRRCNRKARVPSYRAGILDGHGAPSIRAECSHIQPEDASGPRTRGSQG